MKKYILPLFSLLMLIGFSSCEHKDLCYYHPHGKKINVVFDWSEAPEANPSAMMVYFYPVDGSTPTRACLTNHDGGTMQVRVGDYAVAAFNDDTEGTHFAEDQNYEKVYAYTRNGGLFEGALGNGASDTQPTDLEGKQKVTIDADPVWAGTITHYEVTDDENQTVVIKMQRLTRHYTLTSDIVTNMEHASSFCGSISSMTSKITLSTMEQDKEPKTICLPLKKTYEREGSRVLGDWYTLGPIADKNMKYEVRIYVWRRDGKNLYFTFDVTDQVLNAPDPYNVDLKIGSFDVGVSDVPPGGLSVNVDDWPEPIEQEIRV